MAFRGKTEKTYPRPLHLSYPPPIAVSRERHMGSVAMWEAATAERWSVRRGCIAALKPDRRGLAICRKQMATSVACPKISARDADRSVNKQNSAGASISVPQFAWFFDIRWCGTHRVNGFARRPAPSLSAAPTSLPEGREGKRHAPRWVGKAEPGARPLSPLKGGDVPKGQRGGEAACSQPAGLSSSSSDLIRRSSVTILGPRVRPEDDYGKRRGDERGIARCLTPPRTATRDRDRCETAIAVSGRP